MSWFVWTVVCVHVLGLALAGGKPGGSPFSNGVQLLAATTALVSCIWTASRFRGFERIFWSLVGSSVFLWVIAQTGWIYYEDVLHQVVPTISFVNILFYFFFAPIGVLVVWPARSRLEKHELWPMLLDIAQLGVVLLTAYLYFFYVNAFWSGREAQLNQSIRLSSELRNYILLLAILLRSSFSNHRSAGMMFRRLAWVFGTYAIAESFYFHLTPAARINTGHWLDLTWSVPFALIAQFAATAAQSPEEEERRRLRTHATLAFHLIPVLIPAMVLVMASQIVKEQLTLATVSVAASSLIAALRVALAQKTQEQVMSELASARERFQLLFNDNPQAMAVIDAENYSILEVNQAAVDLYGYSRNEFLHVSGEDIRGMQRKEFEADVRVLDRDRFTREVIHLKKGRVPFLARVTGRAIVFGESQAQLVMAEDITERRRAEEELRRSRQMLSLHIQQTPLAYIEWGVDSKIIDWNSAAEKIFGYTKAEALGCDLTLLAVPAEIAKIKSDCEQLVTEGGTNRSTNENRRKDGKIITCTWYNTAIVDDSGKALGTASLVQDVTEQRALEEQLRQSQKMEAIGTLAGGVAHDFNNLLTVITGYGSMLQDRLHADKHAKEDLQEILDAAKRASALTNQLLAFSRKQVIQPLALNLNDSVMQMQRMLKRLIGEDIVVQTALQGDLPNVLADPGQIEQVLLNLAVNARDAMPNGGTLRISTSVVGRDYSRWPESMTSNAGVLLTVSDTGIGMRQDVQAHIFEPFFTTKRGTGTGLGLSTVFGIVRDSGGAISVHSVVDSGSSFFVVLPAIDETTGPLPVSADPSIRSASGSETILIVEDEMRLRELTAEVLRDHGYNVITASNGTDAEQVSMEYGSTIDMLLTDVILPGASGLEVAKSLRGRRPQVRVLYTSGYTDNPAIREALMSGDSNFLQKPFSPAELAIKVRSVLDIRRTDYRTAE